MSKTKETIESAVKYGIEIANNPAVGYDQVHRWLNPDVDCSSLVILCYEHAGVPVREHGATFTGNMRKAFTECGFKSLVYYRGIELKRGDVLLNEQHHTALYIGAGSIVQASINEKGTATGGKGGDQTGREVAVTTFYEYRKGWQYVLRYEDNDEEVTFVNIEMPVLQRGSKCAEVGTLQVLLNALGYKGATGKALTTDHDFGNNTEYAVKNYQRANGLTPDGIVGAKTWGLLLKANY